MNNLKITLATKITIFRIILIPIIVAAIIWHNWLVAFWLTLIAGLSDILDGKLARSRNEKSLLGAILDPLADKLLTLSCFYTLSIYQASYFSHQTNSFSIPYWFFILVLFKELIILLAAGLLLSKNYIKINPSKSGKAAMVSQTILLNTIFLLNYLRLYLATVYLVPFALSLFFILLSLYQYAKIGIKQLILYHTIQK